MFGISADMTIHPIFAEHHYRAICKNGRTLPKAKHAFDFKGGDLSVRRVSWDGREIREGDKRSRYFQLEETDMVPRQFQAATKELAAEWFDHLEKAAGIPSFSNNRHHLRLTLSPPGHPARHGGDSLIFCLRFLRSLNIPA